MKGRLNPRVIVLILLAACAFAFAYMNYNREAQVWPFGTFRVIWVICIAFGLGAGVGALGPGLFDRFRHRSRSLEGMPETLRAGERDHPGRP